MGHDVFISYSKADKVAADAACAILEQEGVRCWIAPRDIRPGVEWGEAIVDGIASSSAFVVVFSSDSNESQQVHREVERAVSHGLSILPVRVADVQPTGSMEYFLSNSHWLDAITPPLEEHLHRLADSIKGLLDIDTGDGAEEPTAPPEPAEWYYAVDGSPIGPMTRSDLEGKIKGGEIGADVRVLKTGEDTWTRVRKYPGLNVLIPAPSVDVVQVEPQATQVESEDTSQGSADVGSEPTGFQMVDRELRKIPYPVRRVFAAIVDLQPSLWPAVVLFDPEYPVPANSLFVLLYPTYFILFEWSPLRATPGKFLARLSVQTNDGYTISFLQSVRRTLAKIVSIAFLGAGLFLARRDNGYRTFHDKFAGTVVVEKAAKA